MFAPPRADEFYRRRQPFLRAIALQYGLLRAAQHIIRHKNRKVAFQFKFWALTLIQIWLVVARPIALPV